MSYSIVLTDGTQLTAVIDGSVDQVSSDLTLIGKNATAYGLFINDNFVHLLENFANITQPNYPIKGQLWYDTQQEKLKVYNGNSFVVTGGTTVSTTPPSGINAGDIWINPNTQQLWFNDGNATILAGPVYTSSQYPSGFFTVDVLDSNSLNHTVVELRVANILLGVFSKDAFTLQPAQDLDNSYPTTIGVGFTASTISGFKFNSTASTASALTDSNTTYPPSAFVKTTGNSIMSGTLTITNTNQLILGPLNDIEFSVQPEYTLAQAFQIKSNTANQNFDISLKNTNAGQQSALFINAQTQHTGIYNNTPRATLDVNGTFRISSSAPTTATDPGVAGQVAWDTDYVYICVADNVWKRASLATWP